MNSGNRRIWRKGNSAELMELVEIIGGQRPVGDAPEGAIRRSS
jgi:hypothetical protein